MERNLAAVKLQELYRRRCDQREREEQQLMGLAQPSVKQVYRGHRNARTMVRRPSCSLLRVTHGCSG